MPAEVKTPKAKLAAHHRARAEAHAACYDALAAAVERDLGALAERVDWQGVTRQLFGLDDEGADPLAPPRLCVVAALPEGGFPLACRYRRCDAGAWALEPWGGADYRVKAQDVPYLDAFWLVVLHAGDGEREHVVGCRDLESALVYARAEG